MNIPISNILYICFSHKYEKKSKKKNIILIKNMYREQNFKIKK